MLLIYSLVKQSREAEENIFSFSLYCTIPIVEMSICVEKNTALFQTDSCHHPRQITHTWKMLKWHQRESNIFNQNPTLADSTMRTSTIGRGFPLLAPTESHQSQTAFVTYRYHLCIDLNHSLWLSSPYATERVCCHGGHAHACTKTYSSQSLDQHTTARKQCIIHFM